MTYYPTIEEDLARAKQLLEHGKPSEWEKKQFTPEVREALRKVGGGMIYGADIYAAYKLLESFVEEIEQLRGICTKLLEVADNYNDIGSLEEGWKSDQLVALIKEAEAKLK